MVSFADSLAHLRCRDGNDQDGQGAACTAQRIGRVAHGHQTEQHQRRAVERPADGAGHGRAAHGRGIAAQIHQRLKPRLLAQRLDDGADQQAGKQALRHGTQRLDEVAPGVMTISFRFKKSFTLDMFLPPFSPGLRHGITCQVSYHTPVKTARENRIFRLKRQISQL